MTSENVRVYIVSYTLSTFPKLRRNTEQAAHAGNVWGIIREGGLSRGDCPGLTGNVIVSIRGEF